MNFLKLKILRTTEPIVFFIIRKLHIDFRVVLCCCMLYKSSGGFRLNFCFLPKLSNTGPLDAKGEPSSIHIYPFFFFFIAKEMFQQKRNINLSVFYYLDCVGYSCSWQISGSSWIVKYYSQQEPGYWEASNHGNKVWVFIVVLTSWELFLKAHCRA